MGSMVLSDKKYLKGHKIRHEIFKSYSGIDYYGRGTNNPIEYKETSLKDYYFSIAMENATYSNMFTEKLTDCFMTGTIPIYYGIPNIGEFFNLDGIILMDENLDINDLNVSLYKSKEKAVLENYKKAKKLLHAEDFIFKQFILPTI